MPICIVYVVKEIASSGGLSELTVAHNRMLTQALRNIRKEAACSLRRNWN